MIGLETVPALSSTARNVKKLYFDAFPRAERVPYPLLRLRCTTKGFELKALRDEGDFAGFVCYYAEGTALYIHYVAVDPAMRGRGIGGRVLETLKERYPDHSIALDIEAIDDAAPNKEQRIKRRSFYERHGFVSSGYGFADDSGAYEVMLFGTPLEAAQYARLIDSVSFGAYHTDLKPFDQVDPQSATRQATHTR